MAPCAGARAARPPAHPAACDACAPNPHARRIVSPSFWGGEAELLVLSKLLKTPIQVYLPESQVPRLRAPKHLRCLSAAGRGGRDAVMRPPQRVAAASEPCRPATAWCTGWGRQVRAGLREDPGVRFAVPQDEERGAEEGGEAAVQREQPLRPAAAVK